jgi:hypothetical protein
MMKKFYPFLIVIAIPVILLLMSNSNGSPGGKTGSIGDNGNTCTQCHSGSAISIPYWITTNVPPEGYTPGQTYTITATGTHTGVVKFGFELTAENSQGAKVGTLLLTEPARTKFTNANKAVTHTSAGNVPSGSTNTWTMNWVAPSNVQGNVGIYAAFNAANGNGNTSGDVIYKSSMFISEYTPPPVLVSILPNEANQGESSQVTITGSNTQFAGNPSVYLSFSGNGFEMVNATNIVVVNSTEIQAEFAIPLLASAGWWDLHVNTLVLENSFTVNLFTGITDNISAGLKIYPNPADDRFTINNAAGAVLSVYDIKGERMLNIEVLQTRQEINITGLSRGLYFVNIRMNGTSQVEKLMVN